MCLTRFTPRIFLISADQHVKKGHGKDFERKRFPAHHGNDLVLLQPYQGQMAVWYVQAVRLDHPAGSVEQDRLAGAFSESIHLATAEENTELDKSSTEESRVEICPKKRLGDLIPVRLSVGQDVVRVTIAWRFYHYAPNGDADD